MLPPDQSGTAIAEVKGKTVGTIHSGEWFGEMAAILGATRTATVRVVTPAEVVVFQGLNDAGLMESMAKDPKLIQKLIGTLAGRLVETSRRSSDATEDTTGTMERHRKAISGTLFALERFCEKYKSNKMLREVMDHLAGVAGIPTGKPEDANLDFFRSSRSIRH